MGERMQRVFGGRRRGRAYAAAAMILSLALIAAGCGCGERSPFRDCHVVLINIETLRADCCGAYGGPEGWTPEMDALANRGILVERAYTVAPWTRPSVASLWTGLYPSQHGADRMDPDHRLPEEAATLAERFAAAGYRTFGAVTNANLSPDLGFAQGFEEYRYRIGAAGDSLATWALAWVDRRIAEAPEEGEGPPLFLALHFDEPHGAFFQTAFRGETDGRSRAEMIRRAESLGDGERIAALEAYRSRVAAVDRAVGELVRGLESRLGPDLLVAITADHGEEWFDHGGLFHGFTLYEELLRVPLLFVSPRFGAARRTGPARNVDVGPTLSAWTGVHPSGPEGGGLPLGRALLGGGSFPEDVFAETNYERPLAARVKDGEKHIIDVNNNTAQIYDLSSDPGEDRDLAGKSPGREARIVSAMEKERAARRDGAIEQDGEGPLGERRRRELERELRSIGYLGSAGTGESPAWPRGERVDWRDLYERHQVLRPGDPEVLFESGQWKEGRFPPRRIGWGDAALSVRAVFRDAWVLFGAHPWSGIAEISVDGAAAERIDLYRPEGGNRQAVVPIHLPDAGPHTIRIRATGEKNAAARGAELLFDGIAIVKEGGEESGRRPEG